MVSLSQKFKRDNKIEKKKEKEKAEMIFLSAPDAVHIISKRLLRVDLT